MLVFLICPYLVFITYLLVSRILCYILSDVVCVQKNNLWVQVVQRLLVSWLPTLLSSVKLRQAKLSLFSQANVVKIITALLDCLIHFGEANAMITSRPTPALQQLQKPLRLRNHCFDCNASLSNATMQQAKDYTFKQNGMEGPANSE